MNETDAALEAYWEKILPEHAHLTAEEQQTLREDLSLCFRYPGQMVAYVDTWQGPGNTAPLARTILAHHSDPYTVQAILGERLDDPTIVIRYIEGPEDQEESSYPNFGECPIGQAS